MEDYILGVVESRFADIIWGAAPMTTGELIKKSEEKLGWKRTTTYTVLKKMCNREIFDMTNGIVSVIITKEEFYAMQSECYVEKSFDGSLPSFLTAFTSRKKLSEKDILELQRIIDKCKCKKKD